MRPVDRPHRVFAKHARRLARGVAEDFAAGDFGRASCETPASSIALALANTMCPVPCVSSTGWSGETRLTAACVG